MNEEGERRGMETITKFMMVVKAVHVTETETAGLHGETVSDLVVGI